MCRNTVWEPGFGGRWIAGKTNDPELYNKFESPGFTFLLARSFWFPLLRWTRIET
jgi:hypothetical protein